MYPSSNSLDLGARWLHTRIRKHLNNGSRSALVELAESLGDDQACLLCFERYHTECHRDVIVEELQELKPRLQVSHL
jgi:hypothetical protein